MSCAPFDLNDYFLGELGEPEAQQVRGHLGACLACREELERLRLTQAALLTLRDEEVPRRIAFVSDKVFERRWRHWLWQSGPRLGFTSAVVLSLAILAHAFLVPSPPVTQPVGTAALEQRLEAAVAKAVAGTEARQAAQIQKAVSAAREELEFRRRADLVAMEENLDLLRKLMNVSYLASNRGGGGQ